MQSSQYINLGNILLVFYYQIVCEWQKHNVIPWFHGVLNKVLYFGKTHKVRILGLQSLSSFKVSLSLLWISTFSVPSLPCLKYSLCLIICSYQLLCLISHVTLLLKIIHCLMTFFFYSKEQMETKLLYAINADAGFDLSWLIPHANYAKCLSSGENCSQIDSLICVVGSIYLHACKCQWPSELPRTS